MITDTSVIPQELREIPQWVLWRFEERDGKPTKVPYMITGAMASCTAPSTWTDFDTAVGNTDGFNGIGFVFSSDDPYVGVDLDDCLDAAGQLDARAEEIVESLATYTEISPSSRGVKLWAQGSKTTTKCRAGITWQDGTKGQVEIYDQARYFTVTGRHLEGTPLTIEHRQKKIDALCSVLFKTDTPGSSPRPRGAIDASDQGVIKLARSDRNGPRFSKLWSGDYSDYPSQSEADLALCSHLGFYCGDDVAQIDRLFRRSALYRAKWERQDYREGTITQAIDNRTEFYDWGRNGRWPKREPTPATDHLPQIVVNGRSTEEMAREAMAVLHEANNPPRTSYRCTDLGNAERFAQQHGDNLRYCHPWKSWLVWNGRRWRKDDTGEVERMAKVTVRSIYEEAANQDDPDKRKTVAEHAKRSEAKERIKAMLALATSEPTIPVIPDQFDVDPWRFNCGNGTIDLRSGKLHPHDRADLITKISPVVFDAEADAPLWHQFIHTIFGGDSHLIEYVQRLLSHALTGDISEQILPVFHGIGANGKSTLLDTVLYVMGDYGTIAPPDLMMVRSNDEHPTELADLLGRRLVVASESEKGRKLRVQLVKRLTGDEMVKARYMRQDYFSFKRTFMTVLVTNNKPHVDEDTEAVWRRLKLVPFGVVIPPEDRDKHLLAKLKAEASGILRWLVDGCLAWQQHGIDEPDAVDSATTTYREESDPLGDWLGESCLVAQNAWIDSEGLRADYERFCKGRGEPPLVGKDYTEALRRHGCEPARRHAGRGWAGIGLLANQGSVTP